MRYTNPRLPLPLRLEPHTAISANENKNSRTKDCIAVLTTLRSHSADTRWSDRSTPGRRCQSTVVSSTLAARRRTAQYPPSLL